MVVVKVDVVVIVSVVVVNVVVDVDVIVSVVVVVVGVVVVDVVVVVVEFYVMLLFADLDCFFCSCGNLGDVSHDVLGCHRFPRSTLSTVGRKRMKYAHYIFRSKHFQNMKDLFSFLWYLEGLFQYSYSRDQIQF